MERKWVFWFSNTVAKDNGYIMCLTHFQITRIQYNNMNITLVHFKPLSSNCKDLTDHSCGNGKYKKNWNKCFNTWLLLLSGIKLAGKLWPRIFLFH